jgi:methionyl-tRNA formyltransferase
MRIVFAGTPDFAVPTLQALLQSKHEVIAVYTQPDKPAGRGQKLHASPVKQLALTHNIPVYQPKTLRDENAQAELGDLNPDVMIVVAYGLILPLVVLTTPKFGCINVHASLLPRWRGAAPIQRSILTGDKETGVTIMQMNEGLDTGAMLKKVTCEISVTDTSETLTHKLSVRGSEALLATLDDLENNKLQPEIQNNDLANYAKKIIKTEAEINWQLSAAEIDCMVRGYNPWPIAYTFFHDQMLRIWQAEVINENSTAAPGAIIHADKNGIDIATGKGVLRILQMQLPNSRCMPVADILNSKAAWFVDGAVLGSPN